MRGMLFAELAILAQLDTVGVILLVLHGIIIALFALLAGESYLVAHGFHLDSLLFQHSKNTPSPAHPTPMFIYYRRIA